MYGLKQAAVSAFNRLKENLAPFGYEPIPHTNGMWKHKTINTKFYLCVDDFGVKYFNDEYTMHLIRALEHNYKLSMDWTGKHFCGLTFDWQYDKNYVDVSMPDYIPDLLKKLLHNLPSKPQYSPYLVTPYGPLKKGQRQYAQTDDTFVCDHCPLKDEKWRVCLVVGGDKLNHDNDSGSLAASLLETKLLINSVISDTSKGSRFMSLDLKGFLYNSNE